MTADSFLSLAMSTPHVQQFPWGCLKAPLLAYPLLYICHGDAHGDAMVDALLKAGLPLTQELNCEPCQRLAPEKRVSVSQLAVLWQMQVVLIN